MADRELVTFLENVGSMPRDVQTSYTAWLGGEPILIDAATCGWVQRRRLYWLVSAKRSIAPDLAPPSCWDWVPQEGGVPTLAYVGDKPLPNKCFFHQGFGPMGTNPPSLLTGFNPSKGNRRNSRNSKEWFSLNSSTVDVQRAAGVAS